MVSALVADDGVPRFVDGVPVIVAGTFPMDRCEVLNTWAMAGMRGTGSHDVLFTDILVPDELVIPIGDAVANLGGSSPWPHLVSPNMPSMRSSSSRR